MDRIETLDNFLRHRFGIGLEQVLLDSASSPTDVTRALDIACRPLGATLYEDGGISDRYESRFVVDGLSYRCRFAVFTDAGGIRFVEGLDDLRVDRWDVRFVVPRGTQGGMR